MTLEKACPAAGEGYVVVQMASPQLYSSGVLVCMIMVSWCSRVEYGQGLVAPCISLIVCRSNTGHELQQVQVLKRDND